MHLGCVYNLGTERSTHVGWESSEHKTRIRPDNCFVHGACTGSPVVSVMRNMRERFLQEYGLSSQSELVPLLHYREAAKNFTLLASG